MKEIRSGNQKSAELAEYDDAWAVRLSHLFLLENEDIFSTCDYKRFYSLSGDPEAYKQTIAMFNKYKGDDKVIDLCVLLERANQIVLTGAPGTGKTYLARQIAMQMILKKSVTDESKLSELDKAKLQDQMELIQFHPSFDYTDFVEGLRPVKSKEGSTLGFERRDGCFKAFCKRAIASGTTRKPYVFIIDEINRGDISKIFGELFFAMDKGYRGEAKGRVKTQYNNLVEERDPFCGGFFVPENVYIIGTMNDIDRNVESMDFAIRRRFTWKEISPETRFDAMWSDITEVGQAVRDEARNRMKRINKTISSTDGLGPAFQIGPSYFRELVTYRKEADQGFQLLWDYHIGPLVREYLRGFPQPESIVTKIKNSYDNLEKEEANSDVQ